MRRKHYETSTDPPDSSLQARKCTLELQTRCQVHFSAYKLDPYPPMAAENKARIHFNGETKLGEMSGVD